jgi:hypothetical protein
MDVKSSCVRAVGLWGGVYMRNPLSTRILHLMFCIFQALLTNILWGGAPLDIFKST